MRWLAPLLLFSLLLVPITSIAQDSFDVPVAITHATVTVEAGNVIQDATILIEDGRIIAVGSDVDIPDSARVLDATGLYAYPGFIDAASHLGIKEGRPDDSLIDNTRGDEYPADQGPRTSMQTANRLGVWPHLGVSDLYKHDPKSVGAYQKQGFTTALITPRPDVVSGAGDIVQLTGNPLRAATLRPRVTQILGFGDLSNVSYSKGRAYPGSPMGAAALIRQMFLDAEWYRARHTLYEQYPTKVKRVEFDPALDAMGDLLDDKQLWIFAVDRASDIHHAIDLAKEFDQRIAILGGREAWKVADRLAEENVPVIVSMKFEEKPELAPKPSKEKKEYATISWTPDFERDFFEPLAVRQDRIQRWEEHVNNLHSLIQAGVRVAITGRDLENPGELQESFEKALELGLTPDELLDTLTQSSANLLGIDDQIGSLEPGKLANVTLLTGPFGDAESKVRHVFIDGERTTYTVGSSEEDADEDADSDEEDSDPRDVHVWTAEYLEDRLIATQTNGNVLLRNATVHTVTRGILLDTDILVTDGKIKELGTDLPPQADVLEIDLTGHWIMPGIVDPHSHIAVTGINEFTESITSEVRQADVVDHTDPAIYRALAGGVTTVHTMHGSANSMGGQNAVLKLKYNTSPAEMLVTSGPRIVKFALGENVTRDRPIPRFPNTRMGVESVFRHAFEAGNEYKAEWDAFEAASARGDVVEIPRRDLRLEAIRDILAGDIWVHSHGYRSDELLRLLTVAEDYGFRIATLQHVLEGYRIAPEMVAHGVGGSTFADWWSYKKEAYDAIPYNAAMMMKAGVLTSLNSDSHDLIRHLNLEAGKTMRFGGLNETEAMRLITINPAKQLGLDERIGSIEVGKDADLAVFTGHPLDTHSRNALTLVEGEIFFQYPGFELPGKRATPDQVFMPTPPRAPLTIPELNSMYAITNATIHPISSPAVSDVTVVIQDGRILEILEGTSYPVGASVIDADGLHVYPGLINAATQMGLTEIASLDETQDSRDLSTYQPELRALSGINPHSEHIAVSMVEGITLSNALPLGGIISGRGSAIQMSGWTVPEMLRSDETGLVISLPVLPSKHTPGIDEKRYDEMLKKHQKSFAKTEEFIRNAQHYAKVKERGQHSETHVRYESMIPYVTGEKPVFFRAQTYKEILQALKFAEVFELRPVILGGAEAYKLADTLAQKKIPVIITSVFRLPSPRSSHVDSYERFDAFYSNPARLEDAGVLFAIASTGAEFARQLPTHAGFAVAHGLSKEMALKSITINAAQILGLDESVGSIELDKTADLIITTGDPTRTTTRTVAVFIDGQPKVLDSLHERNREKFLSRPDPGLKNVESLRGPPALRAR